MGQRRMVFERRLPEASIDSWEGGRRSATLARRACAEGLREQRYSGAVDCDWRSQRL
jgi:hypothetical protein